MLYRLACLALKNYKRSINSRDKEKGNLDLICEAAKCLAALHQLSIILPAVQKLFGVEDSQDFFFFLKSPCLSQTSGLQDECANMNV